MNPLIFTHVTFLHGKGELPDGSVARLEAILAPTHKEVTFATPLIPDLPAEQAFTQFMEQYAARIKPESLLVGLGRGGTIACAIQSARPALRLSVFAVNSPTQEDQLRVVPFQFPLVTEGAIIQLRQLYPARVALYSSAYEPIRGRCNWVPRLAWRFNVPWLSQEMDTSYRVSYLIAAYMRGLDMPKEVAMLSPAVV